MTGDAVYVLGGRTHPGNALSDSYRVDVKNWKAVLLQNSFPARFRHSACVYGEAKIIVFGGCTSEGPVNDVWVMDAKQREAFRPIQTQGPSPMPRMSHGACVQGDWLFVHGGFADYGHVYNDLFKLNLKTFSWEAVCMDPFRLPRCFSHSLVAVAENILAIIGGCCQAEPERITLFNPDSGNMRVLRTEIPVEETWVPIRHEALVFEDRLFVVGGGAFCFSFGSAFSSSFSMELSHLVLIFESGVARKVDIDVPSVRSERVTGIVTRKTEAKKVKDLLKALNWLDPTYKSTVLEMGNRIAFPVLAVHRQCIEELNTLTSPETWAEEKEIDREAVCKLYEWLCHGVAIVQCMDFVRSSAASTLSPAKRLRQMMASRLKGLNVKDNETLTKELPEKWEKLGDMILLPAESMASPFWTKAFGNDLWKDVAEVLDGHRLARQATICASGIQSLFYESHKYVCGLRDKRCTGKVTLWRGWLGHTQGEQHLFPTGCHKVHV